MHTLKKYDDFVTFLVKVFKDPNLFYLLRTEKIISLTFCLSDAFHVALRLNKNIKIKLI